MISPSFPLRVRWPRPASPERAAIGLERWREVAREGEDADFAAALAGDADGRAMLDSIFGNSPFLTQSLLLDGGTLRPFLAQGPDAVFAEVLREAAGLSAEADSGRLMARLRRLRRRASLTIALADIAGAWTLERATGALSDFADAAIDAVACHLLRRAAEAGDLILPDLADPARGSGLVILAMGKLGARELNYSSDVDLILLYDRDIVDYRGPRSVADCFVGLAREFVRMLQDRTGDGYVARVDLRLRPDPASTPLAMSVGAASTYYESMGQNWERAAMIKARAAAGDIEAGRKFLANLSPYVWRKSLDFAAIQDIHSIKRQIHAVKGLHDIAVPGHNVKLGRGGIREIEFFAQVQQLIWGGRMPDLRSPRTCEAIEALAKIGRIEPAAAGDMIAAYRYLRGVEHRLQMIDDRQTQTLPAGPELDGFACFMGADSTDAFTAELSGHLARVEEHYAHLFEEAPSLGGPGSLVFTGADNDPDTVKTLQSMGFGDGGAISGVVRGWHFGRYRATRSARARELLTELMPLLFQAFARTANPDAAFARFDEFLSRLPAGVQLLALLQANPGLLDLIAEVMGGAPRLADHLSRNPALLDAVLTHDFFEALPPPPELRKDLARALRQVRDFEDGLDASRRWVREKQFQAGLRILRHVTDAEAAGGPLSDLADAVIQALQPTVEREFQEKHGRLPGAGMATVALGKLGGREISIGSDLDLIFLYDESGAPGDWANLQSDGPKPLAPIHYYARLAQRFIAALSAPTGEGKLYDVDMRLRPSGTNGPIASSLEGFRLYQEKDAWAWEHMALLRARVVAGDPAFAARIERAIRAILIRPRDGEALRKDVADMRRRIREQHPGERFWDVKHRQGGLVDVEFIAQYLQLRHAAERPGILRRNTVEAFTALADAGILARRAADELAQAARLWRRLQGMMRLTIGESFEESALPASLKVSLARAGGAADFAALKEIVTDSGETVARHFARLIISDA